MFELRRFIVLHLACAFVAAFLAARAVNVVVAHGLRKLAGDEESAGAQPARVEPIEQSRDFEAASLRNIFDARRDVVRGPTSVDPPPPTGSWESAVLTDLRLRLVGTAVFEHEAPSIASILDEVKGAEANMYSVNSCETRGAGQRAGPEPCNRIAGVGTVKRIEPERVYFMNDAEQRYEYVAIDAPQTVGKTAVRTVEVAANDEVPIKRTGEGTWEVAQDEVDRALNDLPSLATSVRIVPAFEGGKSVGFKLFSIRAGSLVAKIGLQNGDVISRINGYEMTSPDRRT